MQATPLFDFSPEQVTCLGPETRTLRADFTWCPVGELAIGDDVIAFERHVPQRHRRKMRIATVRAVAPIQHPVYRITLADGREIVASSEVQWLIDPSAWWMYTRNLREGRPLRWLGAPWQIENSWEAGWLGGVFDGEASLSPATQTGWYISFAQNEGTVLDLAEHLCRKRGYETRRKTDTGRPVKRLFITGIYDCLRFLGECRPVRLIGKSKPWLESRTPTRSRGTIRARRYNIATSKVEFLGVCDAVAIETSTHTLLAEGFLGNLAPMK